jgi:PAS domain S-box-containing protein
LGTEEVWVTPQWRQLFGYAADTPLDLPTVLKRIHPDDRRAVERDVRRTIEKRAEYHGEFRILVPECGERWIAARGRVDAAQPGLAGRMVGASVDVTERKQAEQVMCSLSRRLIQVQEDERARLARELHDDITQRLARLAIDVGRCETGTPEKSPSETARQVREGLVRLSEDVHALSYQLHPAMLEDLGLAAAVKAECDRFSARESLAVETRLVDIPGRVPRDSALCLFRVVQESLRNVARHAQARSVSVSLQVWDQGLQVTIRDDGRGFDTRAQSNGRSLGLAGMRERVSLVAGELDIESAPGEGTTVMAWVPLEKRP